MANKKYFRISEPYGYYIEDVNVAIDRYNEAINGLKNKVINLEATLKNKEKENIRLKKEIMSLQMQLTHLEVPDIADLQEKEIIEKFKNKNKPIKRTEPLRVNDTPIDSDDDETVIVF